MFISVLGIIVKLQLNLDSEMMSV